MKTFPIREHCFSFPKMEQYLLFPLWEHAIIKYKGNILRVISISTLSKYWAKNPKSEQALKAWYKVVTNANWTKPQHVKECYRNASILKDSRVVFNIAGNKYRLIVKINYPKQIVLVQFVGTHKEYDKIDAQTVTLKG